MVSGYEYGEHVAFRCGESTLVGEVEVIDWRGDECEAFSGCEWSYDVMCAHGPDGGPCLCKHIPESDVADTLGIMSNGPLWANNCWFLGHDVVAEVRGLKPAFASDRVYKPWGLPPVLIDTEVYRYEIYYENVLGKEDGWRTHRVEIGEYRGRKVTWIDRWHDDAFDRRGGAR